VSTLNRFVRHRPLWVACLPLAALALLLSLAACDSGVSPDEAQPEGRTTVAFAANSLTLTEQDSTATVEVVLSTPDDRPVGQPVSVDVLFAQGASTADAADLGLPPADDLSGIVLTTITFEADAEGGASQTLTFDIADTDDAEGRETAIFALQNLTTRGTATLGDDAVLRLEIGFPTIAEVREEFADGDQSFTVQGVVSRARGAFTYLQDDPATTDGEIGGLTIRQPGGAFSTEVASGAIQPGTRLQVTGTLSYFAGLAQINEDNLTGYQILEQGEPPAPQSVTLADLDEDFEGELVEVTGVVFASSGTFAGSTNYDVDDGSGGDIVARVPGGSDSQLGGTAIPSGPVTIEAVLGQFHGFDFDDLPDTGYQLLLIDDGDLGTE
jgi:hypothetical protein